MTRAVIQGPPRESRYQTPPRPDRPGPAPAAPERGLYKCVRFGGWSRASWCTGHWLMSPGCSISALQCNGLLVCVDTCGNVHETSQNLCVCDCLNNRCTQLLIMIISMMKAILVVRRHVLDIPSECVMELTWVCWGYTTSRMLVICTEGSSLIVWSERIDMFNSSGAAESNSLIDCSSWHAIRNNV